MVKNPSIGVAFITHNAKHHLKRCLPPFLQSPLSPRVLVVNSSSQDGTVEEAERLGAETLVIPRAAFNHGSTRERARRYLRTDIVVMMTPDAYAKDEYVLEKLVKPILQGQASISYGRQIPHDGADFFESFPRDFNYPAESQVRSIQDAGKYGVYTFFCSDSCAAYSNAALESIGGFRSVLLGEDTIAAAMLLKNGHKIAYTADAVVQHSHRYSLLQEFKRSFDTGLARASCKEIIETGQKDTTRGKLFVKCMCKKLAKENPRLLPYALFQNGVKFLGYLAGRTCVNAPTWLKKKFTSQDFYWTSDDYTAAL